VDSTLGAMLILGGLVGGITIAVMVEKAKAAETAKQKRKLEARSDFTATVVRGQGFTRGWGVAIDGDRQKFAFVDASPNPKIFNFNQLAGVEVERNGQSITKTNRGSQVAGAAIGAVLLGPAGLLLGGLSGSKTAVETIKKLSLKVYVSDFVQPVYEIIFYEQIGSKGAKESDLSMQMGELNAWYGRFHAILATSASRQPNPVVA